MKRETWKPENSRYPIAFKAWTGLEFVYSFNDAGKDRLDDFFDEHENKPIFQYTGVDTADGDMILPEIEC